MSDRKIEIKLSQNFDERSADNAKRQMEQSAERAAAAITDIEREESQKRIAIAEEEAEARKKALTQAAPPAPPEPPSNGGAENVIEGLQLIQENIEKNVAELGDMEDALLRANDALASTNKTLGGSGEELYAFGLQMEEQMQRLADLTAQFQHAATSANDLATSISKGDYSNIDDAQQPAVSIKASYDELRAKMGELKASARELKAEMDGVRQSMLEGAFTPAQAQAIEQLNEKYRETQELLKKLHRFGGETYTDFNNVIHTAASLDETFSKIKDAKKAISEPGGDVSEWIQKYSDDTKDGVDEIIASYEKLRKVEEKQAEQAAKAAEKQRIAAEKKLERLQEAADLEAASIEELKNRLGELTAAREEAKAAGATVDEAKYAEAIKKTTAELERKIKAQERAEKKAKQLENAQKRAGDTFTQTVAGMIRSAVTGTLTIRGLATAIRGIGAAIKTGLGPIGWGILLIEGLIFVAQKAWDWVKKLWEDGAEAAEESAKRQKEALDDLTEAHEKLHDAQVKEQQKEAVEGILEKTAARTKEIEKQLEKEKELLKVQMKQLAFRSSQEEMRFKAARAELEAEYADKEKDDDYYNKLAALEDNHTRTQRQIEDEKRQKEITSTQERLKTAEQTDWSNRADAAKLEAAQKALARTDEQRTRDWKAIASLEARRAEEGLSDKELETINASLERLYALDSAEKEALLASGLHEMYTAFVNNYDAGESTLRAQVDTQLQKAKDRIEESTQTRYDLEGQLRELNNEHQHEEMLRVEEDRAVNANREAERKRRDLAKRKKKERDEKKQKQDQLEDESNLAEGQAKETAKSAKRAARDIRQKNEDKIATRLDTHKDETGVQELYRSVARNGDLSMLRSILRELKSDGAAIRQQEWGTDKLEQYGATEIGEMASLRGKDRDFWQQRFQQLEQSLRLDNQGDALGRAAEALDDAAGAHKETIDGIGDSAQALALAYQEQLSEIKRLRKELEKALKSITHLRK